MRVKSLPYTGKRKRGKDEGWVFGELFGVTLRDGSTLYVQHSGNDADPRTVHATLTCVAVQEQAGTDIEMEDAKHWVPLPGLEAPLPGGRFCDCVPPEQAVLMALTSAKVWLPRWRARGTRVAGLPVLEPAVVSAFTRSVAASLAPPSGRKYGGRKSKERLP